MYITHSALALATAALFTLGCSESLGSELSASAQGAAAGDLTGTWVLNVEDSQLPERRMGPGPRGHGPHDSVRTRLRQHRGDSAGVRPDGPPPRPRMMGRMTITQTDSTVVIAGVSDRQLTFYPDGRSVEQAMGPRGSVTVEARWDGDALVITRTMPRGALTETFTVTGGQLRIATAVTGPDDRKMEFVRVYDRE